MIKALKILYYFDDDDELYKEYEVYFEYKGKKLYAHYHLALSGAWDEKYIAFCDEGEYERLSKNAPLLIDDLECTPFTEEELIKAFDMLCESGEELIKYMEHDEWCKIK